MNTIETILSHRSIRSYKNDPIPENILEEILTAAIRGSTTEIAVITLLLQR